MHAHAPRVRGVGSAPLVNVRRYPPCQDIRPKRPDGSPSRQIVRHQDGVGRCGAGLSPHPVSEFWRTWGRSWASGSGSQPSGATTGGGVPAFSRTVRDSSSGTAHLCHGPRRGRQAGAPSTVRSTTSPGPATPPRVHLRVPARRRHRTDLARGSSPSSLAVARIESPCSCACWIAFERASCRGVGARSCWLALPHGGSFPGAPGPIAFVRACRPRGVRRFPVGHVPRLLANPSASIGGVAHRRARVGGWSHRH